MVDVDVDSFRLFQDQRKVRVGRGDANNERPVDCHWEAAVHDGLYGAAMALSRLRRKKRFLDLMIIHLTHPPRPELSPFFPSPRSRGLSSSHTSFWNTS